MQQNVVRQCGADGCAAQGGPAQEVVVVEQTRAGRLMQQRADHSKGAASGSPFSGAARGSPLYWRSMWLALMCFQ